MTKWYNTTMVPFVGVGLAVIEKMEIHDEAGRKAIMRFAKLYSPEKMGIIVQQAQAFWWWHKNPTAAFMKAVGIVNRYEKEKREKNDNDGASQQASERNK